MPDKLKATNENNEEIEIEIIATFEIADFNRKYIIYSFDEVDPNGLAKLHVSQIIEEGDKYTLAKIETDEEWTRIKNVMREIISGGNV